MTYYSHLIKDDRLKRISKPIKEKDRIIDKENLTVAEKVIKWYEDKWEKEREGTFSLITKSLAGHSLKEKPDKYFLKLI